jgi:hypothetical protein
MAFDEPETGGGSESRDDKTIPGGWAAGAVLAIVVLLAGWVVWPRGDNDDDNVGAGDGSAQGAVAGSPSTDALTPGAGTESGTGSGSGVPGGADEGDCPDLPSGAEIPETAPAVDWEIYFSGALPVSEEHGPAVLEGDLARCYSHTPTGALLAAVQIEYRILLARDGVGVARGQTVAGEGQDRLVDALEQRGWEQPTPGEICQVAGFRVVTYTAADAVISLASRCSASGTLQLTEAHMQWTGGDWRRVLAADGSLSPTASALNSLSGMVEWGGV